MSQTAIYTEYIASEAWQKKRKEKLEQVGYKCDRAGDIRYRICDDGSTEAIDMCSGYLQVHHIRYSSLGNEPLSDLVVLCEWHHKEEHQRWEINKHYKEQRKLRHEW